MTPCEERNYKVGDLFRVATPDEYPYDPPPFASGSTVRLEFDDGTDRPLFALVEGHCRHKNAEGGKPGAFEYLEFLRPVSGHLELRTQLQIAVARIEDMLLGDDAQAWDEAEKALPAMKRALGNEK